MHRTGWTQAEGGGYGLDPMSPKRGSEGGGYGARLSNNCNMYSIGSVDNTPVGMSAMHRTQQGGKKIWPRSRGERSHKVTGGKSRQEGTQGAQGRRREAPAV